ncbi:MAG TPA: glycosyltransferase family 2 protein, partial [Burkholderiaceae bacterium]|nr:glycosyltransferase family 2 protein [Burkholderiaceae bacterium]
LQRANVWLHQLNHERRARRKLRRQRAADRAWRAADDPRRPEVARSLRERQTNCGGDVRFSVMVWPGGEPPARDDASAALASSWHSNWELLWPRGVQPPSGTDAYLRSYDAQGATGPGLVDIALRNASGSHLALIPARWAIAPHALMLVAEAIGRFPQARLIYGDDDCIDSHGRRHSPCMRCDWNLELLRSTPYVNGLVVVRRDAWRPLGPMPVQERAARWAALLRWTEPLQAHEVLHLPHVLGHQLVDTRPSHEPPLPTGDELGVVQAHLDRCAPGAVALPGAEGGVHVRYPVPDPAPLVSLIVPTRNGLLLLRQCLQSILDKTDYPRYEILVVDNGSDDAATLDYLHSVRSDPRIRVHRDDRPFNFSALNNAAAGLCRGELLGLINNDIEVIDGGWLREMVGLALRHDVGAVGARLWFADDTLQHAGVILGIGGVAGHIHCQLPRSQPGYQGRARLTQEFSAVTAACVVLRREVFEAMGGLDETNLAVDYNDIDLCLRMRRAGYRVIWTPHAQLYHHESATRGRRRSTAQQQRYDREVAFMQSTWGTWLQNDPAYNPNLTLRGTHFELSEQPRVNLVDPWYRVPRPSAAAAPIDNLQQP